MRHPDVPRGPARHVRGPGAPTTAIEHLQALGSRRSSCCRCTTSSTRRYLVDKGLPNYWGYNSIGFFAPHAMYAATGRDGEQVREFKGMVKALHAAGIEVILDVVYNHTAEGNHLGPTLSFKGIDNPSVLPRSPEDPRYYVDFTGTGNSLNAATRRCCS